MRSAIPPDYTILDPFTHHIHQLHQGKGGQNVAFSDICHIAPPHMPDNLIYFALNIKYFWAHPVVV